MEYTFEESIKKSLNLLCARPGQKISNELYESWVIALAGCSPQYILRATYTLLKDKGTDYLPAPGKVRSICKQLKIVDTNKKDCGNHERHITKNGELSKAEAIKIQQNLKRNMPSFKKIPVEKIDLMTYEDIFGNTVKIISYGHCDQNIFYKNCVNQFRISPKKIFKGFHRETTKTGCDGRIYLTMEQCASDSGGTPIMIGIV